VVAEKPCGARLEKELRQALGIKSVDLFTSETELKGREWDGVVVYARGAHMAHRGVRAAVYSSMNGTVALWAVAPPAAHDRILGATAPKAVEFERRTDTGVAIVARAAGGGHKEDRDQEVDILGQRSIKGARTRFFLVWTTDAGGWGTLRWLVIQTIVRVVPEAEIFVFANKLPEDHFNDYPQVRLVRYDEVALFDDTPLAAWARNMPQWREVCRCRWRRWGGGGGERTWLH
jgi:hypothetical protein